MADLILQSGVVDKVSGVAGTVILLSMLAVFDSAFARIVVLSAVVAALVGASQAFAKQIRLSPDGIMVRNTFWQTRLFTYQDVDRVVLDPTSVLAIVMKDGDTVTFPAKARRVDEAFRLLLTRTGLAPQRTDEPER